MKDKIKYFDKITFFLILIISIIGVVLIFSASHTHNTSFHVKQMLRILVSIILFFVVFQIRTEKLFKLSFAIYVILIIILIIQILAGKIMSGTRSWIKLGFFYIQVSEFIKVFLCLSLARYLTKVKIIDWGVFFKISIYVGIPFLLIALQPDLGTAFILLSFLVIAVFLKGIKPVIVVVSILLIVAGSFAAIKFVLKPYQKARLISFLNPEKYKDSSGYQVIQSKIAIGSGGMYGKGFLKGSQSRYNFLPTRHTDFILSVLGEEFGFFGITIILLLFFIVFFRLVNSDIENEDEFYFIILFTGVIFFQFFINILMTIGFFPVLGVPLPFVSYGGSSILAFFIGEGIVFRIKINKFVK
jgi:rod shape determining protein RodA